MEITIYKFSSDEWRGITHKPISLGTIIRVEDNISDYYAVVVNVGIERPRLEVKMLNAYNLTEQGDKAVDVMAIPIGAYSEVSGWIPRFVPVSSSGAAKITHPEKLPVLSSNVLSYIDTLIENYPFAAKAHLKSVWGKTVPRRTDAALVGDALFEQHYNTLVNIANDVHLKLTERWETVGVDGNYIETINYSIVSPNQLQIYTIEDPGVKQRILTLVEKESITTPAPIDFRSNLSELSRFAPWRVSLRPVATIDTLEGDGEIAKQISHWPNIGAKIRPVTQGEVKRLFPGEIQLGWYLDKETPIYISWDALLTHFGIFGSTGTGKSIAMRLILTQALASSGHKIRPALVMFDIHNEYGASWKDTKHGINLIGLNQVSERLSVIGVGQKRFKTPDGIEHSAQSAIKIPLKMVYPAHLLQAANILRLPAKASDTIDAVWKRFVRLSKSQNPASDILSNLTIWDVFKEIFDGDEILTDLFLGDGRINEWSFNAVARTVVRLFWGDDDGLRPMWTRDDDGKIQKIHDMLQRGQQIVFVNLPENQGERTVITTVLLSDILKFWENLPKSEHQHLWIVADEAHNIVPRDIKVPIFEKLATESRKWRVSMLLSTQMPSRLYEKVLAQIGAVLTYNMDSKEFEALNKLHIPAPMISSLAQKRQAILAGSGVIIPAAVWILDYNKFIERFLVKNTSLKESLPSSTSASQTPEQASNSTSSDSAGAMDMETFADIFD